jgi:tetratricopeptide (TPR) repeat protein
MLNVAQAYLALEKWNEVVTWGKKAVSCDPKNYLGYQQLAFAYIKLKNNWDEAIRMAQKAVSLKDTAQTRKVLADAKKGKEAAEYIAQQKAEEERIRKMQEEERRRAEEMQRKIKEYEARTGRKVEGGGGGDDGKKE